MAYDEKLADRIRNSLTGMSGVTEKKMFGGLSFLLQGKMACGVLNDDLVVRVDPNESEKLLKKPHVRLMDFTGRPMKGFLYVSPDGLKTDRHLMGWIEMGIEYASALSKQATTKKR